MPISSSRRRLTSPFVGTSASSTSSLLNTTSKSNSQVAKPTIKEGGNARSDNRLEARKRGNLTIDSRSAGGRSRRNTTPTLKFPVLNRVQPGYLQQLKANNSSSPTLSKHHRRGRTTTPTTPSSAKTKQHGDQRLSMVRDQFALKKIRFFDEAPQPAPLTLCFSYPGYDLTHMDVLEGIRKRRPIDVKRVKNIQFIDMNVLLGAAGVENRWLITLKDPEARYKLFRDGLSIKGERVFLRRYDDVNFEDYRDYLRRKNTLQSDAHTAVQRLLSL